jgi:hypothetical protein
MSVVAGLGLSEARKKFSDFDDYRQDIGGILEKYPNMDFEDAYIMAKSKRAGTVPPRSQTETERPAASATVPTRGRAGNSMPTDDEFAVIAARGRQAASRDAEQKVAGIVGFRNLVDAAVDRLLK